ncbi:MAG: hypothetical protein M0C28_30965 [Candidatus Moduliflexus flocculans]|nr:hypothetical protein [Candidatus Moduliflexus flocculans]
MNESAKYICHVVSTAALDGQTRRAMCDLYLSCYEATTQGAVRERSAQQGRGAVAACWAAACRVHDPPGLQCRVARRGDPGRVLWRHGRRSAALGTAGPVPELGAADGPHQAAAARKASCVVLAGQGPSHLSLPASVCEEVPSA